MHGRGPSVISPLISPVTCFSQDVGSHSCKIKRRYTFLFNFCAVSIGKQYHSEDPGDAPELDPFKGD